MAHLQKVQAPLFLGIFLLWAQAAHAAPGASVVTVSPPRDSGIRESRSLLYEEVEPALRSDKGLLAAWALSAFLDTIAESRGYFAEVPDYRLNYAVETLFEKLLPSPVAPELRYEALKKRIGTGAFVYLLTWDPPEAPGLPSEGHWRKVVDSKVEWPSVELRWPEGLPGEYREFRRKIREELDRIYRAQTRAKIFYSLAVEYFPSQARTPDQVSPREMAGYYLSNAEDFREKPTRFELMELRFPSEHERSSFLEEATRIQRLCTEKPHRSPSDLSRSRKDCARRIEAAAIAKHPDLFHRNYQLEHPFKNPADTPPHVLRFALDAKLGSIYIPSVNYQVSATEHGTLFMVTEETEGSRQVPFSDPDVQRRLRSTVSRLSIESLLPRTVRKIFRDHVFWAEGDSEALAEDLISEGATLGQAGIARTLVMDRRKLIAAPPKAIPESHAPTAPAPPADPVTPSPAPEEGRILYRFPEVYNANPVGGRLYLQPIGAHEDQVIEGLQIQVTQATSAEYNRYFHEHPRVSKWFNTSHLGPNDTLVRINTYALQVKISGGYRVNGVKLENGAIFRTSIDQHSDNFLSVFLMEFHKAVHAPVMIPHPNQPWSGSVGPNKTLVIGKDGRIFITSAELYAKIQLLEHGSLQPLPNLSTKFSVRVPLDSTRFNQFGMALSVGLSNEISPWLSYLVAGSLTFQDLGRGDFNADDNLSVNRWAADLFAGLVLDPEERGGFYATLGVRLSTPRARYRSHSRSNQLSKVLCGSLNYRSSDGSWEVIAFVQEEIPFTGAALEADLVVGLSFAVYLDRANSRTTRTVRHE